MAEINKIKVGETTYDVRDSSVGSAIDFKIGTLSKLVDFEDGQNLYIGTQAPQIQIGTGSASIRLSSGQSIQIGDVSKGITIGSSGSVKIKGVEFSGSTSNGIALQDRYLLIGTNKYVGEGEIYSVWIGTDSCAETYLCCERINLRGKTDISLGSVVGYQYEDNGTLIIGTGVMGSANSIAIGAPNNKPVEITIGSMYNDHCGIRLTPSTVNGDSIEMICGNSLIEFYSGGGIGIHESGNGLNIGTGGKGYVNMDDKVSIGGFLFETDKSTSKLIISYNGKKAEIQLN